MARFGSLLYKLTRHTLGYTCTGRNCNLRKRARHVRVIAQLKCGFGNHEKLEIETLFHGLMLSLNLSAARLKVEWATDTSHAGVLVVVVFITMGRTSLFPGHGRAESMLIAWRLFSCFPLPLFLGHLRLSHVFWPTCVCQFQWVAGTRGITSGDKKTEKGVQ